MQEERLPCTHARIGHVGRLKDKMTGDAVGTRSSCPMSILKQDHKSWRLDSSLDRALISHLFLFPATVEYTMRPICILGAYLRAALATRGRQSILTLQRTV